MTDDDDLLWDIPTICQKLGNISKTKVHRLMNDGEFRRIKPTLHGNTFAPVTEVKAYVARISAEDYKAPSPSKGGKIND